MNFNDLSIYLTEECDFACTYCYYKKNFKTTLSYDKIKSSIENYFSNIANKNKKIVVTILGGEPLLKKELLFKTIDLLNLKKDKEKLNIKIIVFTNGSLLTKEYAEELIRKRVKIILSFDGIKKANDSYRKIRNENKSAFEKVFENIKNFSEEFKKNISINMVVGPKNCQYLMDNIYFFQDLDFFQIDINLMSYAV